MPMHHAISIVRIMHCSSGRLPGMLRVKLLSDTYLGLTRFLLPAV
jgi:hypothetical protein